MITNIINYSRYFRSCNYNIDETFNLIVNMFKLRYQYYVTEKHNLTNTIPNIKDLLKSGIAYIAGYNNNTNSFLILVKCKYFLYEFSKYNTMLDAAYLLFDEMYSINPSFNTITLIDTSEFNGLYAIPATYNFINVIDKTDAFKGERTHRVLVTNQSVFVNTIIRIAKSVLHKRSMSKVDIIEDMNDIFK